MEPKTALSLILAGGSLVVLLAVVVVLIRARRRSGAAPNYRRLFIIGICFIPIGVATTNLFNNPAFLIVSLIYMGIGLANRDKWQKRAE